MPSTDTTDATDAAGPTYRLLLAVYAALLATGAASGWLVARTATVAVVVPAAIGVWFGATIVVAALLARRGVPAPLRPRRLYSAGWSWAPTLVGGLPLVAVTGALVASTLHVAPVAVAAVGRQVGPLLFAGLAAPVGWLLRLMGRNAEARARLDASPSVVEWRARPDRRRRRWFYGLAGAFTAGILAGVAWLREPSLVGTLGGAFALAAQGATEWRYWLGERTLVYGNPQVRHVVDAEDIVGVTRREGSLRIERRGWRPALSIDTADLDDPDAVAAALTRLAGTSERRR